MPSHSGLPLAFLALALVATPPLDARAQGGSWVPAGSVATGRFGGVCVPLADGRVLIAAGTDGLTGGPLASAEIYDPAGDSWSPTGSLTHARYYPVGARLPDGRVIVAGGGFGSGATAEIWDPATGLFTLTSPMLETRATAAGVLLADGRFLVTGGENLGVGSATAEVYDPSTGLWTAAGTMAHGRWAHSAVQLADGRVFVSGGPVGYASYAGTELWSPTGLSFSAGPALSTGRSQHATIRLGDGRILIVGGVHTGFEAVAAEIYDPAAGTTTPLPMAAARYDTPFAAVTLSDGRVLVAGGVNSPPPVALASCELFDPATSSFSAGPSMAVPRTGHGTAVLADGSVLVVSGRTMADRLADTRTCERFVPVAANRPPVSDAGADLSVECEGPEGSSVTLDASGSSDPDGDSLTYTWTGPFGTVTGAVVTVTVPDGAHAIVLTVEDGKGGTDTDGVTVTVSDTTDPEVSAASASPSVLWPPNHRMVPVTISVEALDLCDESLDFAIVAVTSDEPVNGTGDGDAGPDWEVTGPLTLDLRAERAGGGDGRVYTVTLACTDGAGNTATKDVIVTVPHSKKK
jgi:hypothetical protein